tara:strand:+ start:2716 stop:3306 length:591 start_codon:yes stop_codon:yes gene_type:complete
MDYKNRYKTNAYATHQPVLEEILKLNDKPILELGCGEGSTEMISYYSKLKSLKSLSIEKDKSWMDKYTHLATDLQTFKHIEDFDEWFEFYSNIDVEWGLVFVDQGDWMSREKAVRYYKDDADYIVLHDCDYFATNNLLGTESIAIKNKNRRGARNYDDVFKYWTEYFPTFWFGRTGPPTLLASNKIDITKINIDMS